MIFALYIVDVWLQSDICSFFCALLEIGGKMITILFMVEVISEGMKDDN